MKHFRVNIQPLSCSASLRRADPCRTISSLSFHCCRSSSLRVRPHFIKLSFVIMVGEDSQLFFLPSSSVVVSVSAYIFFLLYASSTEHIYNFYRLCFITISYESSPPTSFMGRFWVAFALLRAADSFICRSRGRLHGSANIWLRSWARNNNTQNFAFSNFFCCSHCSTFLILHNLLGNKSLYIERAPRSRNFAIYFFCLCLASEIIINILRDFLYVD